MPIKVQLRIFKKLTKWQVDEMTSRQNEAAATEKKPLKTEKDIKKAFR